MIAKIIKLTKEILNSHEGDSFRGYSYNLPLFDIVLNSAFRQEFSEYVLQIWIPGPQHSRYPAWRSQINYDELKKINAYWEYCVENNKDVIEFEL